MSGYFNLQSFSSFRRKDPIIAENQKNGDEFDPSTSPRLADRDPPSVGQTTTTTNAGEVDSFKSWTVVLGSFLAHLVVLGLLYAFGIFVIPLSTEFGVSRAEVSLVGTINVAFFYVAGIFSGPLADRFGVRPVVSTGAVVWVAGCFLASFTNALWQQIVTQGIMIGLGTSFVYWPAISVVPQWFDKYRGTAVGFAALGAGLGNLIFALGGQAIISSLGWRNTLRVMGGAGGVLLCFVILLVERRVPPRKGGGLFDVAKVLIKLNSYRWFLFGTFLFQWGFFVPFVHIAAYTRDLGIETTLQGLAVAMLGIGSSVGRVAIGPLADYVGRMNTFRACMFLASVTLACWPACLDISSILTFAFFYAFFAGGFIAQSPVVAGDLWGVNSLGGTFALVNLVMVPGGLACGPIAGLVYERYGSYRGAIWGAAIFLFLSSCCLLMVKKEKVVGLNDPEPSKAQVNTTSSQESFAVPAQANVSPSTHDIEAQSTDKPKLEALTTDNPKFEKVSLA